jgi:hypothetical protein
MTVSSPVEVLNLPKVLKGFALLRAQAPNAVIGEANVTARLITQSAKKIAPVGKGRKGRKRRRGQYKAGITPKFATKGSGTTDIEALAMAKAPHSQFVEAGTGQRGAASWKNQITGYVHGSKPGMKAFNIFHRVQAFHEPGHRKRIIAAINKETQ